MTTLLLQVAISNLVLSVPLALIAYAVHRSQRSPTLAHLLWVLVLVKLVTPPIFALPVVAFPNISAHAASAPIQTAEAVLDVETKLATGGIHAVTEASLAAQPALSLDSLIAVSKSGALALWIAGCLFVLFRSLKSVFRFNRQLGSACRLVDPAVQELASEAAEQLGLRSCPKVYSVPTEIAPLVWWIGGRAKVVIPEKVELHYQPHEIQWILAHELSHIKRGDHLIRWLEWFVCVVFWWNPIAWWARHCLRANEEVCCDAMVMNALQPDPQSYGLLLLQIVEFVSSPGIRPPIEACAINSGDSLDRRFRMLVSMKTDTKVSQWLSGGLLALAMGLLPFGIASGQDYDAVERRLGAAVGDGEITLSQAQAMMRALRTTSEDQKSKKEEAAYALRSDETPTAALKIATNDLKASIKERLRNHAEGLRKQLAAGEITQEELKVKIEAAEFFGIGPNMGFSFGYYGRFNRIIARIKTNPELEVIRTTLHRDTTLEDFYITVRTQDEREVRLRFEGADTRPFSELLQELKKVGM